MREYYFTFSEGLKRGLRDKKSNLRDQQACVEAFNAKCGKYGLLPYNPFEPPVDLEEEFGTVVTWPFPYMISKRHYNFLLERDTVETVDKLYTISDAGVLTKIAEFSLITYGEWGDVFDFADAGTYLIGTNGLCLFWYDPHAVSWSTSVSTDKVPLVKTITNFKGQLIGGNVQSDWYSCGSNHVVWSAIGEADFRIGRDNPEAGKREMPWNGDVLRVLRLGDYVMVYGDNGIAALKPATSPMVTYALDEVFSTGIPNKMAVAGDEHSHVFVDRKGYVWRVGRNLELEQTGVEASYPRVKKLGYQEFFEDMDGDDIVVSHDPDENEFFISDGNECYLLTGYGLTEVFQLVTSVGKIGDEVVAAYIDSEDYEYRITTDTLQMGLRGHKTVQSLEFGVDTEANVYGSVDWRVNKSSAFQTRPWVIANNEGVVSCPCAGSDLRLKFKADDYEDVKLDTITARYKLTDMRSIRGVYAPSPRGQSAGQVTS